MGKKPITKNDLLIISITLFIMLIFMAAVAIEYIVIYIKCKEVAPILFGAFFITLFIFSLLFFVRFVVQKNRKIAPISNIHFIEDTVSANFDKPQNTKEEKTRLLSPIVVVGGIVLLLFVIPISIDFFYHVYQDFLSLFK